MVKTIWGDIGDNHQTTNIHSYKVKLQIGLSSPQQVAT